MNPGPRVPLTIDPDTHLIVLPPGIEEPFSDHMWGLLAPPDCPVCGTTVEVDKIDVTPNEAYHVAHGRCYIPGLWHCPHDCDPRTGERVHYSQSYGTSMAQPGTTATCSCGDETVVLNEAEFDAWRAVHHPKGL